MSTYLACFIVSDFVYKEQSIRANEIGEDFKMRVYARPGQLDNVDFALESGVALTEYFIQYFQTEYPLPKLGEWLTITKLIYQLVWILK